LGFSKSFGLLHRVVLEHISYEIIPQMSLD